MNAARAGSTRLRIERRTSARVGERVAGTGFFVTRLSAFGSRVFGSRSAIELVDADLVAPALEGRLEPDPDEGQCLVGREQPLADADHIGVVVRSSQTGRLLAPDDRAAHASNAVGGHRLAVAGPTEHDATITTALGDRERGRAHRVRVVNRVGRGGAEVNELMPANPQVVGGQLLVPK